MNRALFYITIICITLTSCELLKPDNHIPGYLFIDSQDFETDYANEGTDSHKITEIWVYDEGKMLGAYEVPGLVPILRDEETRISLYAGIKNNGISSSRMAYPFYDEIVDTKRIVPGKTDTVSPVFNYVNNLKFWREEFDSDFGHNFDSGPGSESDLNIIKDEDVFEGKGSGKVVLDGDKRYFDIFINDDDFVVDAGNRAWIEMNYSANNPFDVGLKVYDAGQILRVSALIINTTTDSADEPQWNKIYVDLAPITSQFLTASRFEFYIRSNKELGVDVAKYYFDNIKLVQFDN